MQAATTSAQHSTAQRAQYEKAGRPLSLKQRKKTPVLLRTHTHVVHTCWLHHLLAAARTAVYSLREAMLVRRRLGEVPGLKAKGPRMSRKTHRSTFSGKLAATRDATAPPMECPTKENRSQPRDLAWRNRHSIKHGSLVLNCAAATETTDRSRMSRTHAHFVSVLHHC